MNKKNWLAAALLPLSFLAAQRPRQYILRRAGEMQERDRQHAILINDLAGHIQTEADARRLVDMVAAEFSRDELPSHLATRRLRTRIARAEFESATNPRTLIPDELTAAAWDNFANKIGAPQQTLLSAAEVHYLLDAQYVTAQLAWARNRQNLWTLPNIYAIDANGRVADGSRALEAIQLLWSLGNTTENFGSIHEAAQKGVLISDRIPHPEKPPVPGSERGVIVARGVAYPIEIAANQYIRRHGSAAFNHAVEDLLNELFPSATR